MSDRNAYTYDAFISYRHTDLDKKVAAKLHRMLETYKIPASIIKQAGKKKITRVFRDRDELPTSSNLADNISIALEKSEYLIVICSPRTPQSQWVLKEIETFKALHGHDKILALLIEGEPSESFPHQLRFVTGAKLLEDGTYHEFTEEVEPLAADIRASSEAEMFKKLKTEILRLLSPMLKCKYDDLRQRHRERFIRTVLAISLSASAFFLAFGSFSTWQALLINQKSQEVVKKSLELEQKNQEILSQIKQTQISQSRYLADISNQLYEEGDRYRAILAAQEALPKDLANPERPYVPEAEYALSQALHVYDADDTPDMDIVLDHTKDVGFLEISPDGKTLLTASTDGMLYLWDTEAGKRLASINVGDNSSYGYQALFLDNTRIIAPAGETTTCFDIHGNVLWQYEEYAYKMALSPDKKRLACDIAYNIAILDVETGELLLSVASSEQADFGSNGIFVSVMAFSNASDTLAVGVSNGNLFLMDASSGALKNTFRTGYNNICSLEFSDEDQLVAASYDFDQENLVFGKGMGCLNVFNNLGNEPILSLKFPDSRIDKATIHPFNPSWVVLTESEKLNVIDIKNGETIYTFIHGDKVTDYKVFDTFILSSSLDGTVRFLMTQGLGYEYDYSRMTFPSPIEEMAHGKGKFAVYYPQSNKVYLMKYLVNEKIVKAEVHKDYISNGCFSADGKTALTFDMDNDQDTEKGLICLWDAENNTLLNKKLMGETIREAEFIDSGSKIFVWLKSNHLLILNTADLSVLYEYQSEDYIHSVKVNPELTYAALATYGDVFVCSLKDLKVINRFDEFIDSFDFSSNNNLLLASDTGIKLYNIVSGEVKFSREEENVIKGTLSYDGKQVALAYQDKTIKILNTEASPTEILTIKDNGLNVSTLFFSKDAKALFIGYEDNSLSFFETQTGALLNNPGRDYLSEPMERLIFSNQGDRFACLDGTGRGLIFDASSYKVLAAAPMLDIRPDFKAILSRNVYFAVFMPVYNTQMLLDEAMKQLDGRTLTNEEKRRLFIE